MDKDFTIRGFVVWGLCATFFLYEFLLRTILGTYQLSISTDMGLSTVQFSFLSSTVFVFVYGLMQLPVGIITGRFGLKVSVVIGVFFCAISCIGFSLSHHYIISLVFRILMGLGASFGFICLLISVDNWMPRRHRGLFIGLSQFIGALGPMLAAGPIEALSSSTGYGWRSVLFFLGIVGFLLLLLLHFFVFNSAHRAGKYIILNRPVRNIASLKAFFSRGQVWCIAVISACLYFSIEYLSENEGRNLLVLKGFTPGNAAYMLTLAWLGYALACPILGFVSDRLERRRIILFLSSFLSVISLWFILYGPHDFLIGALFMMGFSAGGQGVGFATMADYCKREFVAVGFAFNNAILNTFSAVSAPMLGFILDKKQAQGGLNLTDYISTLNVLIGIGFLALILSYKFFKETYTKTVASFTVLEPQKSPPWNA